MIADLKPYPEYRESGLPWVGQMPGHWALAPNRAMLRRRKVLVGKRHSDFKLLSLTKGGVIVRDITNGKGKFSADMGTSQEVRNGDLVFCLFDVPETPRTVGLSCYDGMITGAYTVFECSDALLARYLELFYKAMDDRKLLSPLYSGLRNTIPPPRFLGTKTPIPPSDEQTAIVRFLDHVSRRIERTIKAKRKVIALLNEQKQVIIHHAVIRGLDPNVRLKPSGIAWLGDIPENWETIRCGHLFQETNDVGHSDLRLLSIDRIKGIIPQSDTGRRERASKDRSKYKRVQCGQLAYNLMNAFMGSIAISNYDGIVSPAYATAKPTRAINGLYYHYLLKTNLYTGEYSRRSYGIMYERNRLYFERFKLVMALVPPVHEQENIVNWIEENTASITVTMTRIEREIDLLCEYRTRLIADVVTGKLDVREAAAQLPDELEELESFDEIDDSAEIEDLDAVAEGEA